MRVDTTRRARVWGLPLSLAGFRRLAYLAFGLLVLVVVSGAVVRLTASGLGCDNWPRCGDTPFPERDFHAAVEFSNRVVALLTMVATVLAALGARRVEGLPRRVARLALVVAVGTIAQIPLGGLTVVLDLHPLAVMSHFLLALLMLALSVVVVLEARALEGGIAPPPALPRRLAWLALGLLPMGLALVVTGAFATAAGPHSGGADIQRLWELRDAVYVHVRVSAAFGLAFLLLVGALAWLGHSARRELLLALGVLVLLVGQMAIGEIQWRSHLPYLVVLVHVALGAVVWSGLVAVAVRLVWASAGSRRALPGAMALVER